jgi:glycosyltransferase involved in cell wall biosynthesis
MATLSVVMPTKNCLGLVRASLPSLAFADEIVVVDMFSTDGTAEYVRATPRTKLIQRDGYIEENVNVGIDAAIGDWIYLADSDEIPTPELQREMRAVIEDAPPAVNGYYIPNAVYWSGQQLRYGPQYDPKAKVPGERFRRRLFRRGSARFAAETYHEDLSTTGEWGYLTHRYDHYTIPTLSRWFEKTNFYTTGDAERIDCSRMSIPLLGLKMIVLPLKEFLVFYLKRRGYKDGVLGIVTCGSYAATKFMQQAKLWEQRIHRDDPDWKKPRSAVD